MFLCLPLRSLSNTATLLCTYYTYIEYVAKNKKKSSLSMLEFPDDNKQEISKQKLFNTFH